MTSIKIYGYSDDLIEVEGDISEEFDVYGQAGEPLEFSDGTVMQWSFDDDGFWRFFLPDPDGCPLAMVRHVAPQHEEPESYSDIVEVRGDFQWVRLGDREAWAL